MTPDELEEKERLERQAADADSPLGPAQSSDDLPDTHPATDSIMDDEELYQEGFSGASEASEPNSDSDVVDYLNPDEHQED